MYCALSCPAVSRRPLDKACWTPFELPRTSPGQRSCSTTLWTKVQHHPFHSGGIHLSHCLSVSLSLSVSQSISFTLSLPLSLSFSNSLSLSLTLSLTLSLSLSPGTFDGTAERVWILDPVDGTKGFMRGEHYCIALALLSGGERKMQVRAGRLPGVMV